MEKFLNVFFFFILAIGCSVAELKRCTKQGHCNLDTECCSKRFMHEEAYCVPLRKIGQLCLYNQMMVNGTYDINCPCEDGLECRKPEFFDGNGNLLYSENPQCVISRTEQLPMEYYIRRRNSHRDSYPYQTYPVRNQPYQTGSYAEAGNENAYQPYQIRNQPYQAGSYAEAESGNAYYRPNGYPPNSVSNAYAYRRR